MIPPPKSSTGASTYWGLTGSIPKAIAIPTINPYNRVSMPALVVSVSPDADNAGRVLFQAASSPGVDPIDITLYSGYIKEGGWIYIPDVAVCLQIQGIVQVENTAYAGVIGGRLPTVADAAWQNNSFSMVTEALSYSLAIGGTGATIDGVAMVPGTNIQEPSTNSLSAPPCAFDASAAGNIILISFSTR